MENKYCKDCVYHDAKNWRDEDTYLCEHPTNLTGKTSLVTGKKYTYYSPHNLRNSSIEDRCGPEGIYHKTHAQRVAEAQARAGISPVKNTEQANPSLTLLTRLSKMKFDVDKL